MINCPSYFWYGSAFLLQAKSVINSEMLNFKVVLNISATQKYKSIRRFQLPLPYVKLGLLV